MATPAYFRIEREPDGVGVLHVDNPSAPVNTMSKAFLEGLEVILPTLETDRTLKGLVVVSDKADWFVGADLKEIEQFENLDHVREMHGRLGRCFDRCAALPYPTCAAVAGNAPGGGTEWALVWKHRVASLDPQAVFSQAEVLLGLIPGAGGTQRLPRLVGFVNALEMITTGKRIYAKKAVGMGLVEEAVAGAVLLQASLDLVRRAIRGEPIVRKGPGVAARMTDVGVVASMVAGQARKKIRAASNGLYPAPELALDCLIEGWGLPLAEALALEGRKFCPIVLDPVSRSLRHLFHVTQHLKKREVLDGEAAKPLPVDLLGIVGGGFMGSGIAQVALEAGSRVYVKDVDAPALGRTVGAVHKYFVDKAKRGQIGRHQVPLLTGRLTPGTLDQGLKRASLIIEAVPEKLELKQAVLETVEQLTGGEAIFASNTSSIPIAQIAAKARFPENVIGMHFFSPVAKMRLLEIIVPPGASARTVATAVAYGRKLGKDVILVRDRTGFYTTRVVGAYGNEMSHALMEGASVVDIDRAMTKVGFMVGPLQLADEVGLDVSRKVNHILHQAFGDRLAPPVGWERLSPEDRLGRKNAKGFYLYKEGKRLGPDPWVEAQRAEQRTRPVPTREDMQDRGLYSFVGEAIRCLEEGVLPGPEEGDAGAVLGLGFPPNLGGPFHFVDCRGAPAVLQKMLELKQRHGDRFAPPALLEQMAKENRRFFDKAP